MMIGEFDYADIFVEPPNGVPYPVVTYMLFVAFLILMSIIIMNLLVSAMVFLRRRNNNELCMKLFVGSTRRRKSHLCANQGPRQTLIFNT